SNLCSKVPGSCVIAALMLLSLLLSLQPRPQQHNSDNHTTTTASLYAIVGEIAISIDVIIILSITLLELTRPISLMVHFVLPFDCNRSRKNNKEGNDKDDNDLSPTKPKGGRF
ncbi:MAG: hypothetical protein M3251_06270, partial [Thermoproteota archaeon]|nr:hypothetical protein [Thermoproteota archaeon]